MKLSIKLLFLGILFLLIVSNVNSTKPATKRKQTQPNLQQQLQVDDENTKELNNKNTISQGKSSVQQFQQEQKPPEESQQKQATNIRKTIVTQRIHLDSNEEDDDDETDQDTTTITSEYMGSTSKDPMQFQIELTPEMMAKLRNDIKSSGIQGNLDVTQFLVKTLDDAFDTKEYLFAKNLPKSSNDNINSNSNNNNNNNKLGGGTTTTTTLSNPSSMLNDKLLPGRTQFLAGQFKRGYHLIDPSSTSHKHPRQSSIDYTGGKGLKDLFVYKGGDVDMESAIKLLETAANLGNHRAMFILGLVEEVGEAGVMNFTRAAKWYHMAADQYGNPDAQYSLGFLYSTGKGVVMDEAKAILYHTFAARAGHMVAKLALAYRYHHGYGTEKNCLKSAKLYEEVARLVVDDNELRGFGYQIHSSKLTEDFQHDETSQQDKSDIVDYFKYSASIGDPNALVTMANLYLQGGLGVNQDFRVAFKYYSEAADQNYPAGIAGIGFMYSKGYDVDQDNKTAVLYFKKAYNLGHLGAQTNLAEMYLHGYGVEQNQAQALHLFTEAAEKGDIDATINLGKMYANGIYVGRDVNKAFQFFTIAVQQGSLVAAYHLARLNLHHNHQSPQSCTSSVLMYKKVAEKGPWAMILSQAQDLYEEGDEERALLFFEKAAEMGIDIAQNNAAWMYDKRIGIINNNPEIYQQQSNSDNEEKDNNNNIFIDDDLLADEQAFRYYSHSAQQNNAIAHLKLGDYFYYGKGVEASIEQAAEEYQKAATLQDSQALFNLGYMHQFGQGRSQDLFLAKRYYDMSLQTQPNAYIPVYLALGGLFIHFVYFYIYSFFNPSVSFSQSTSKMIDFQITKVPSSQSHPSPASQSPAGTTGGEGYTQIEDDFLSPNDKDDFSYDGLIILCLMILGYLVLRRQRIIHNNNRNNRQNPNNNPPL